MKHWTHEVETHDEDIPGDDAHIAQVAALRVPLSHIVASCLPYSGAGTDEALHVLDHLADAGFQVVPIMPDVIAARDSALASMANDLIAKDQQLATALADKQRLALMFDALIAGRTAVRAERNQLAEEVEDIVEVLADALGLDTEEVESAGIGECIRTALS